MSNDTVAQERQTYIVPPCQEEVEILFADADVLVANKPAGLLSVPGRHELNRDCLITRIQQQYPTATVVHRLDLDTSGLLVVALNKPAHVHLSRQFEQREVDKTYTAVVFGLLAANKGSIDLPLCLDWPNRPLHHVDHEHGKPSLTHYEVIERDTLGQTTRVLLYPVTGRSHQLRVHMKELGHPILGCTLYAHGPARAMAPRLLLHATTLSFTHPVSGKRLEFNVPPRF